MKPGNNKKAGILVFPGTNCETDLDMVLRDFGFETEFLWHTNAFDVSHDIYFVPGGFSYGDYLRSGSLAARSVSVNSLQEATRKGKTVVGICNGFQILTESHLLPGALIKNSGLKHICKWVDLEGAGKWKFDEDYRLPVSHSEGNYIAPEDVIKKLEDEERILLRYKSDVNGSTNRIACITNESQNVIGLMPHPERAMYASVDNAYSAKSPGRQFFQQVFENM